MGATKIADIELKKKDNNILTLNTKEKYVDNDVYFTIANPDAVIVASSASADVDVDSTDSSSINGVNISDSIGEKTTTEPSSGYFIRLNASGSMTPTVSKGGWIDTGSLSPVSASTTKFFPVTASTVTQNAPTVNSSGLVTATSSATAGYTPAQTKSNTLQLSTQGATIVAPTESEQTAVTAGKYTTGVVKVGAISSTYVGSGIDRRTSEDLSVSGKTITAPSGYYASSASASVALGSVKSGSANISSVNVAYDAANGDFDITGSANVSAPSVVSAGYISSTEGTKSANNGAATVSANLGKIAGTTSFSGASTRKPSISKQATPSGVTNAASGDATTTAPTSGVYVAVKTSANTGTLTATPSVTTEGYGTSAQHGIAANTQTVGALASEMTYVPITTTSATVSGKTVSYGSGWISAGSKSVADGSVTENTPTVDAATGIVTGSSTSTAGYISAGTKTKTLQLPTKTAETYPFTTLTGATISAGQYLVGDQTILQAYTSGITPGNIKYNETVKVGDEENNGRIHDVTGTFTKASTVSSGQTAASASQIRSGYSAWVNGEEVKGNINDAIFANTGTSGVTYTDKSSSAPVLVAGDYLYVNKGYTDNIKISLAKLVPDGSDVKGHSEYIISGHSAYDNDGTLVAGSIPTLTASDVSVSGRTVTIPTQKYTGASGATAVTKSIGVGTITSGTASITSLTKTYNSTNDNFDITGSANVSAPTVGTAGYVSSSEGTRNAKSGGATVNATIPKIVATTAMSGATSARTPSITKQATPTGVTNAASGDATTTAPSSGVYVAVKSAANTGTITATPTVTTAGYGDATNNGITGTSATVGAAASATTYVPITTTTASVSGKTVSYGSGWITAGSKSVADGAYSADSSTSSNSTITPSVGLDASATSSYGFTTTKPSSGTTGTNYLTIDPGASATAWSVTPRANITTAGYLAAGNKTGTAVSNTPSVATGTNYYVPVVSNSFDGGGISITTNYSKTDLAVTMADGSDKNVSNYTVGAKDTTNYPYYVKVSGSTPAVSGKTKATRAAATYTNSAGVIAAHSGTQIWGSSVVEPTVSVNAASGATYVGFKSAAISGSSTNATATTTVAPGTVSISKQSTPSGVTNAASGNATTTAPTSGVYVAVKATAAANTTGTTSAISGSGTATVGTAGYAPTTLTGSVTVSGIATAKTSAKDSSMTYVPITTANPAFTGGGLSGTATASGNGVSISDSTNNSGISISTACTATRANVTYNGAVAGWVSKSSSTVALSSGSTAMTAKTYYVNGVTLTAPSSGTRTFSVTVPNGTSTATFVFNVDTSGNVTITES